MPISAQTVKDVYNVIRGKAPLFVPGGTFDSIMYRKRNKNQSNMKLYEYILTQLFEFTPVKHPLTVDAGGTPVTDADLEGLQRGINELATWKDGDGTIWGRSKESVFPPGTPMKQKRSDFYASQANKPKIPYDPSQSAAGAHKIISKEYDFKNLSDKDLQELYNSLPKDTSEERKALKFFRPIPEYDGINGWSIRDAIEREFKLRDRKKNPIKGVGIGNPNPGAYQVDDTKVVWDPSTGQYDHPALPGYEKWDPGYRDSQPVYRTPQEKADMEALDKKHTYVPKQWVSKRSQGINPLAGESNPAPANPPKPAPSPQSVQAQTQAHAAAPSSPPPPPPHSPGRATQETVEEVGRKGSKLEAVLGGILGAGAIGGGYLLHRRGQKEAEKELNKMARTKAGLAAIIAAGGVGATYLINKKAKNDKMDADMKRAAYYNSLRGDRR